MPNKVKLDPEAIYVCESYLYWIRQVRSRKGRGVYTVTWYSFLNGFLCTCRGAEFWLMCWHIAEDAQPMHCGWAAFKDGDQPLIYQDERGLRCPRCRGPVVALSPVF